MYLLLDLSVHNLIHLALFDKNSRNDKEVEAQNRDLLSVIDSFLVEQQIGPKDIEGIMAVFGEGSFTSSRLSAVVANTFAYVQNIPLLGIKKEDVGRAQELIAELLEQPKGQYISATYSGEPNIGGK